MDEIEIGALRSKVRISIDCSREQKLAGRTWPPKGGSALRRGADAREGPSSITVFRHSTYKTGQYQTSPPSQQSKFREVCGQEFGDGDGDRDGERREGLVMWLWPEPEKNIHEQSSPLLQGTSVRGSASLPRRCAHKSSWHDRLQKEDRPGRTRTSIHPRPRGPQLYHGIAARSSPVEDSPRFHTWSASGFRARARSIRSRKFSVRHGSPSGDFPA